VKKLILAAALIASTFAAPARAGSLYGPGEPIFEKAAEDIANYLAIVGDNEKSVAGLLWALLAARGDHCYGAAATGAIEKEVLATAQTRFAGFDDTTFYDFRQMMRAQFDQSWPALSVEQKTLICKGASQIFNDMAPDLAAFYETRIENEAAQDGLTVAQAKAKGFRK
jgi:hypothetical protein